MLFKKQTSTFTFAVIRVDPARQYWCHVCKRNGPCIKTEVTIEAQIDDKRQVSHTLNNLCCDMETCRETVERNLFAAARSWLGQVA
ncbi:MAG: hypothetical protein HYV42_04250 [Candidatus Magasanikbacteria bacterium]|nr:hypothetical protein [Candidatus Magasanikbacteria bacterium]